MPGRFKKGILHLLYYGLARRLPVWIAPGGGFYRGLRYSICRRMLGACGENVLIGKGAAFSNPEAIRIGSNSTIGVNAWLEGCVEIGSNVMMGANCEIYTRNHRFERLDIPVREQGFAESPVRIGDDVWIASRVILLPGVTIGKGAVIGAGAVVPHDIPSYAVAAGNPAKVIKFRTGGKGASAGSAVRSERSRQSAGRKVRARKKIKAA